MSLPILLPQQLQGQMTMLPELLVNRLPVRLRPLHSSHHHGRIPEQLGFQFLFAQTFGQGPADPGCCRPLQILMDCAQPNRAAARDLPLPQPQLEP
jgi:hypothetical protein